MNSSKCVVCLCTNKQQQKKKNKFLCFVNVCSCAIHTHGIFYSLVNFCLHFSHFRILHKTTEWQNGPTQSKCMCPFIVASEITFSFWANIVICVLTVFIWFVYLGRLFDFNTHINTHWNSSSMLDSFDGRMCLSLYWVVHRELVSWRRYSRYRCWTSVPMGHIDTFTNSWNGDTRNHFVRPFACEINNFYSRSGKIMNWLCVSCQTKKCNFFQSKNSSKNFFVQFLTRGQTERINIIWLYSIKS